MAIKIKDISVLKRYGFKLNIGRNFERYWEYYCLDKGAYVWVFEDDLIVRFNSPIDEDEVDDVIFKLIKDGHCELKENDE